MNSLPSGGKTTGYVSRFAVLLVSVTAALACGESTAQSLTGNPAKVNAPSAAATEPARPSSAVSRASGGFAPNLKPVLKRRVGDVAYAPVKLLDDQGQTPEIEMFAGESRVLPAPGVGRIAVGNGQILTAAALDKREILLFANQPGTSSLFIWNEDGRYQRLKINIVPGDTSRIGREIAAFLVSIPGARASIVGDKVIVEGERLSDADLAKLKKLEGTYPQIVNFTSAQGWEKMVMMDVKVVEFPRSEMRELGLKWSPTGGGTIGAVWAPIRQGNNGPYQINIPSNSTQGVGPVSDPGQTTTTLHSALNVIGGFNIGLNTQLQALAQDGKAVVLAEPQLSTRSGSEAKFVAGGEYPYTVSNITGTTVLFKPYGIQLTIKPTVDQEGYVRATINTEVSSIDSSVSTPEGPALKTRSTKTEFNVKAGETIVLSGMLTRDNSTNVDKVPFLGDIPVLGALFRSKRFQNSETELVVFVTPIVVDSQTPGLVDRVERTKARLQEQFGPAPYLTDPLQPGRQAERLTEASSLHQPGHAEDAKRALPAPAPQQDIGKPAPRTPLTGSALVPAAQNPLTRSAQPLGGGSSLRVKLEGLVLRASPDIRSPTLMRLGNGSVVQLGNQEAPPELRSLWRNVLVGAVNGWVAAKWVEPTTRAFAANTDEGPAAREAQGGQALGAPISPGHLVPLTVPAPDESVKVVRQYRVALPKLAMRVAPDVNAAILQQIPEGTMVETSEASARGGWLPVDAGGKHGWVAAQWLEAQP
ncbi:pilus assembly protein N-terminal domain-containing protein [Aquabacterium sp.]|uniref:pilus assembly protein N-terminal domain-containing protein n=1 Tax=Aquabacterium sp. TaxID=1872578 RepID=UPI0019A221BD|nr:pilus assembly protein N-terminal domain-containing protein [Aquabacterium sp.]MBC7699454.1 pilus assembly protein N-terminal domain-containing protein [Aquabacterium sp.]